LIPTKENVMAQFAKTTKLVAGLLFGLLGAGGGIVALLRYMDEPMPSMSTLELATDRYGGDDYSNFAAASAEACSQACLADSRCQSFSFNIDAGQCWLKGDVPLRVDNRTFVSGVKRLH
jgi:hypothetical protein